MPESSSFSMACERPAFALDGSRLSALTRTYVQSLYRSSQPRCASEVPLAPRIPENNQLPHARLDFGRSAALRHSEYDVQWQSGPPGSGGFLSFHYSNPAGARRATLVEPGAADPFSDLNWH